MPESAERENAGFPACPDLTPLILESISEGVFTVDLDWRITSFNRAAEQITGIDRKEAIGRLCSEVLRASMCEDRCALRQTMKTARPIAGRSGFIVNAEGRQIPVTVSTAILHDEKGDIVGGVEIFRDLSVVEQLRKELEGRFQLGDLVSRSKAMQAIFDILPQVAQSSSTVLIQGETGTGKELLAKAIHDLSPRRKAPFVAVNCSAIPESLLESELFGYKAGAFTGAVRDKPGRFSLANGGTLFLDEIGDLKPEVQVRLLRVLQERTYEPLGATRSQRADVRLVAATHRDLDRLVHQGCFRQDLFYRINVIRLQLPPLRQRKEDIALLADHFIHKLNTMQAKSIQGLSAQALHLMMAYDFPGNVRELENMIEHAFVLCDGERIEPRHLPPPLGCTPAEKNGRGSSRQALAQLEKQLILQALEQHGHNKSAAAGYLGIHRSTLFRKMKSLGICTSVAAGGGGGAGSNDVALLQRDGE